jgi:hypothetical protein
VIFKNIPSEILAAYRVGEEPVRRRALRRRAYALYRILNTRCFGDELPKHPQIVVCGLSEISVETYADIGSSVDSWLRKEGIYEEVSASAIKRLLARLVHPVPSGPHSQP